MQNRNVHISVLNSVLWDMVQVHCRICEVCLLFDQFVYKLTELCSRQISVSKEMQYDDAFTLQKVEPEYVEIFNYMAGMVPFIQKVIAEVRAFIIRSREISRFWAWVFKLQYRY